MTRLVEYNTEKIRLLALGEETIAATELLKRRYKRARNMYHRHVKAGAVKRKHDTEKQLQQMPPEERTKVMFSHIKNAAWCKQETSEKASHITMNFEGLKVKADGESNIAQVLSAYTELVSIDETTPKTHVQHNLKRSCRYYDDGGVSTSAQFDNDFRRTMDQKYNCIMKETDTNNTNFIFHKHAALCAHKFTASELKRAIKCYKKKLMKAAGYDDITNWMIVCGGSKAHDFLLEYYNEMWELQYMPTDLYTTGISY